MGNGVLANGPKLPRPSSTLPPQECQRVRSDGESWESSRPSVNVGQSTQMTDIHLDLGARE